MRRLVLIVVCAGMVVARMANAAPQETDVAKLIDATAGGVGPGSDR